MDSPQRHSEMPTGTASTPASPRRLRHRTTRRPPCGWHPPTLRLEAAPAKPPLRRPPSTASTPQQRVEPAHPGSEERRAGDGNRTRAVSCQVVKLHTTGLCATLYL